MACLRITEHMNSRTVCCTKMESGDKPGRQVVSKPWFATASHFPRKLLRTPDQGPLKLIPALKQKQTVEQVSFKSSCNTGEVTTDPTRFIACD